MRKYRPNPKGVWERPKPVIRHSGQITPYTKVNPSLARIDKLIECKKPKICITRRQGGIGDVLMTTPTIKSISQKYDIQVDYGTDFNYCDGALPDVLKYNKYINRVIPWEDVVVEDYDAVIDLTCPCVAHEQPQAKPINRIDLFARHARVYLEDTNIDYEVSEEEKQWAQQLFRDNNILPDKSVFIQPSASALHRSIPVDKLKKIVANIIQLRPDIKPIIITHNTDPQSADWNFSNILRLHNYNIRQMAAVLSQSPLVVCPDSVVLHLASALHKPTFTLFGPTDPRARVNYHPEAVGYWPAGHLASYPTWYAPITDGGLCWKLIDEAVVVRSIIAMMDKSALPKSNDFIIYGSTPIEIKQYEVL